MSLPSSFLFFLAFGLVLSCRPSVGPSSGHIIELIVPANSNLVPSGLGLRPECMMILFSFFSFFSFHFLSVPFLFCPSLYNSPFSSSCSGVRMYHGYVPGVMSLQVIRDGIPQPVIVPLPLRTGTAVYVLFVCFLPLRGFSY